MSPSLRPRILLFEWITGGGCRDRPLQELPSSLLHEGDAMVQAAAADFANAGCVVQLVRDSRFPPVSMSDFDVIEIQSAERLLARMGELASQADGSLVIAPEFDQILHGLAQVIEHAGGRLLSPDSQFVSLASDKYALNRWLAERGVRVPDSQTIAPGQALPTDVRYPRVLKPRYGAGSIGVRYIDGPTQQINVDDDADHYAAGAVLESFCPGLAASVAVIRNAESWMILEPCEQLFLDEASFQYRGGRLPLSRSLASRATKLATHVTRTLPATVGYFGMDIVLGHTAAEDTLIEVNPRLTTSYLGLRRRYETNLAAVMLSAARCPFTALQSAQSLPILKELRDRENMTFTVDGASVRWEA